MMKISRRKLLATSRSKHAASEAGAVWRLATRDPIFAYDEYSGVEIELDVGQRDPNKIEGLLIDFRYVSRDREISRRSVLCWQCGRDDNRLYVRGYCAFREELRTFRVDRMSDVVAIHGEHEVSVENAATFFAAFAARETTQSASPRLVAPGRARVSG
jgi:hypothetical protein